MRDGDGVDVRETASGRCERFADDGQGVFDVRAAGDFRDDAPVLRVQLDLRRDDVAANVATVDHDGGAGFIACGLDAKNDRQTLLPWHGLPARVKNILIEHGRAAHATRITYSSP